MLKFIPLVIQAGIAGIESSAVEYLQSDLSLTQLLIDQPAATYIGYADGESMTGDGIFSGDLLIISRSEKTRDQDIVVANLNGVFVCKKIDKSNSRLISSAPGFHPYTLKEGDEFQVEGVVIRSIRMHRPVREFS